MIVRGISGTVGKDLVFRQMRDGSTIVSAKPDFSNRIFSNGQLTHQSRFQQAASYARAAAKTNPIYAQLAKGTLKTAYNIALSDWFNPPIIHTVERLAGCIRINASDNVLVINVCVAILDGQGKTLEQGQAVPIKESWWEYVTMREGQIRIEAFDHAGNVTKIDL